MAAMVEMMVMSGGDSDSGEGRGGWGLERGIGYYIMFRGNGRMKGL